MTEIWKKYITFGLEALEEMSQRNYGIFFSYGVKDGQFQILTHEGCADALEEQGIKFLHGQSYAPSICNTAKAFESTDEYNELIGKYGCGEYARTKFLSEATLVPKKGTIVAGDETFTFEKLQARLEGVRKALF